MLIVETLWQPILPHVKKVKVKTVETFTVEGIKSEVLSDKRFRDFKWENTDWAIRVCVKFTDLDSAKRLIRSMRSAGLVAICDWVE